MTCSGTAAECPAAPCETNRAAIRAAHAREREARQNASRKGKIPTPQRRRGKAGRRGPLLLKAAALRSLRRMENATRSRVALRGRSELQESFSKAARFRRPASDGLAASSTARSVPALQEAARLRATLNRSLSSWRSRVGALRTKLSRRRKQMARTRGVTVNDYT